MRRRGLILAATVAGMAVAGAVGVHAAGGDDGYDPRAVQERVRCRVAPGPPLPTLRLTRKQTIRATRRVILRNARSRSSMLGRLLDGRRFTLKQPGTVEQAPERGGGENIRTGGSYELVFAGPVRLSGTVPATGAAPKGFSRRYTRRYGYMPYLQRVSGTVTALEVTVDLRDGRIQEVLDSFQFNRGAGLARRSVPGRCPLAQLPPSND